MIEDRIVLNCYTAALAADGAERCRSVTCLSSSRRIGLARSPTSRKAPAK